MSTEAHVRFDRQMNIIQARCELNCALTDLKVIPSYRKLEMPALVDMNMAAAQAYIELAITRLNELEQSLLATR